MKNSGLIYGGIGAAVVLIGFGVYNMYRTETDEEGLDRSKKDLENMRRGGGGSTPKKTINNRKQKNKSAKRNNM